MFSRRIRHEKQMIVNAWGHKSGVYVSCCDRHCRYVKTSWNYVNKWSFCFNVWEEGVTLMTKEATHSAPFLSVLRDFSAIFAINVNA
jgi:hypothetical protein